MAVKVLIRRKFKEVSDKDIMALVVSARKIAMDMDGYISTESLVNLDDRRCVVLISTWHSREDWDNYFNSEIRKENERKFAEILEDTQYEFFRMGFKL